MREQGTRTATPDRPWYENPWNPDQDPLLTQVGDGYRIEGDGQAAVYADWAARLREKGAARTRAESPAAGTEGYWSPEALFEDSRRLAREADVADRNPWAVRELLAVLDLREGATRADIGHAYRRLAKQHHPDRYALADPRTQAYHEAEMRRVIDAYAALCQLVA